MQLKSKPTEFVQLHLTNGQPVAVNPLLVRYLVSSDSPAGTGLYFTAAEAIFVSETYSQVVAALQLP